MCFVLERKRVTRCILSGREVFLHHAQVVIRRTGRRMRRWAKYLVGWLRGGTKVEISLGLAAPAELRAILHRIPDGLGALEDYLARLVQRLGVVQVFAVLEGLDRIAVQVGV